jgi:hypothetical protein
LFPATAPGIIALVPSLALAIISATLIHCACKKWLFAALLAFFYPATMTAGVFPGDIGCIYVLDAMTQFVATSRAVVAFLGIQIEGEEKNA